MVAEISDNLRDATGDHQLGHEAKFNAPLAEGAGANDSIPGKSSGDERYAGEPDGHIAFR